MKHLFLIDGAAGTGKTDLISYVHTKFSASGTASFVRKYTTRKHRIEEKKRNVKLDLEFCTDENLQDIIRSEECYVYEYGGENYAFKRHDLDCALSNYQCVFVIVRSLDIIQTIKKTYRLVNVVSVYIHSDSYQVRQRLMDDGYDEDSIGYRLDRQKLVWGDYLRHSEVYDEVIINNSVRTDFQRTIERLVHKYRNPSSDILSISPDQTFNLPKPLVGHRDLPPVVVPPLC